MNVMWWVAALAAVIVLRPVLMWVIAHVLGGWIGRKALRSSQRPSISRAGTIWRGRIARPRARW